VIPAASFQQYLPIAELLKIIAVCIAVAVAAPTSAALVITGFEAKANATGGGRRLAGDARIAAGVLEIAAMIAAGIYAMTNK
jgi:Cdc6-like AAA superfamily ATPase